MNQIQLDPSEQLAEVEAEQEARRQAALSGREDDVAKIRFAEDDGDDFYDQAGMDEADLKYMQKFEDDSASTWKSEKKSRSSGGNSDDSLEAKIGAKEARDGLDTEAVDDGEAREVITMGSDDKTLANRIDGINLTIIRYFILASILWIVIDYLGRANVYRESYLPMPLPSAWTNAFVSMPAVWTRPSKPRRKMVDELKWLWRRGDAFIYLTDDDARANQAIEELAPYAQKRRRMDLFRLDDGEWSKDYVFEALWYGRACFVAGPGSDPQAWIRGLLEPLKKRRETRARVRQTVHLVWDMQTVLPDELEKDLAQLAETTGWSLMLHEKPQNTE